MRFDHGTSFGGLCVVVFVIAAAVRDVFFGGVFQTVSIFAVLFIAFSTTTVFGIALALLRRNGGLAAIFSAPADMLAINITTALAWTCYFFALKWIEPSIAATLFAGVAPFTVLAFTAAGHSIGVPVASSQGQKAIQIALLGVLAALIAIVVGGQSGMAGENGATSLAGAALSLLAGVLITVSLMFCKRLNENGASPEAVLGTRFIGLVLLAGTVLASGGGHGPLPDIEAGLSLMPLAVLLIVLPVYLQQIGISKVGPMHAKIIATIGPALVFLAQSFDDRIAWSTPTLCAICAYSALSLLSNFTQRKAYLTSA